MARVKYVANQGQTKLQGVPELRAALEELGQEVATRTGRAANRDAAKVLQDAFVDIAPYRPGVQLKYWKVKSGATRSQDYGDLRDNIKVRLARARSESTITYNVTTGNAFWAGFLEFGTVNMAARPWMRPAFDAFTNVLINVQIDRLKVGIDRAAKRIARKNRAVLSNGRNA